MIFPIPCVIFAGGRSSRMGQDKSLLPFRGHKSLTHFQYARLLPLFESLYISTKIDKFGKAFPLILDDYKDVFSPMVALASVLEAFKDTYIFCLSVDAPFVEKEQIQKLWNAALETKAKAIIPQDANTKHPLCGLYHSSLAKKAREFATTQNHKLSFLLEKNTTCFVDFEDSAPFANLNHFSEYEAAL
ncbi:MAG: molybdenum cofactor guanylyltransferase MobA [Campylobacteraceae bacterium]|nr:molybdenum cofactor guanylyltransferase MobA [Campylobacteraceae bacterium]